MKTFYPFKAATETYEEHWLFRVFAWVLLTALFSALCYIAWINIAPYQMLVRTMDSGNQWLENMPLIGLIAKAWGAVVLSITGVLLWALVQSLQCLWILIGLDRKALNGAIYEARKTNHSGDDGRNSDRRVRNIQRKARAIPFFFIRWGALLSLGAYVFDLIIGLTLYPPASSFDRFTFALSTGMWKFIDFANLWKLLVMLFAFEFVLVLFIVVAQWIWSRNQHD